MAQYFTDFSEYSLGQISNNESDADWTAWLYYHDAWDIVTVSGDKRLSNPSTNGARRALTWDAVPSVADVEIYAEVPPNVGGGFPNSTFALRLDPAQNLYNNGNSAYLCRVGLQGSNATVFGYANSSTFSAASAAHGVSDTANAKVRVRVVGANFKVRIWAAGDPEPTTWLIDVDDSTISTAGLVGSNFFNGGGVFTTYGVGTNGDPAPTSAVVVGGVVMTISEATGISDSHESALSAIFNVSESINSSDDFASKFSVVFSINESLATTDSASIRKIIFLSISESTSIIDQESAKLSASLSVTESAGTSDADQGQYATSQQLVDAAQASDQAGALLSALLAQSLGAVASGAVNFKAAYGLVISETASAQDTSGSVASFNLSMPEGISGSDSTSAPVDGNVNINIGEVSAAKDGMGITASFSMTVSESAFAADSIFARSAFLASISESFSAVESSSSTSAFAFTLGEFANIADLFSSGEGALKGLITAIVNVSPAITLSASASPMINGKPSVNLTINGSITAR